ncbi:hypothetical protein ABPG77_004457 [Micractinium sp. CCAP 211/92]
MPVIAMQRAAAVAPTRSAGALRRNNNALRAGGAARPVPAAPRRQRVLTQAAVLPTAVKVVADMAGAFVLVFCGLNWASLRRVRKEVEKVEQERVGKDSERKARIQKLTGHGDRSSDSSE